MVSKLKRKAVKLNPEEQDAEEEAVDRIKIADFTYECPLYRTANRNGTFTSMGFSTNFIMYISIPASQPSQHWLLRGVAAVVESWQGKKEKVGAMKMGNEKRRVC